MKQNDLKSEKGMTLVEILAALVILGIMFVGIMTIFPQMTNFNTITETKLDTMNLARQEMADITESDKWRFGLVPAYLQEPKVTEEMVKIGYSLESIGTDYWRYQKIGNGYRYEADIYHSCETESAIETQCPESQVIKLYKSHLKIYNENQLSSETFSYITHTVTTQGALE